MDPGTIVTIIIAVTSALGGGGVAWGALHADLKYLKARVQASETKVDQLEQANRDYERQAAEGVMTAVRAMSTALEHLANLATRYDERMARVEARSLGNRDRIGKLERARTAEARRKLEVAGVPSQVIDELSDVLGPRDRDESEALTKPREETSKR